MKVLVVAGKYPPLHSGAGLRAHRLYKRLHEKFGVKSTVLSLQKGVDDKEKEKYEGIVVYRFKSGKGLIQKIYQTGKFIINNNLYSTDIVHCVGTDLFQVVVALWSKIFSKKLIMESTVNEIIGNERFGEKIRNLMNFIRFRAIRNILYKKSDMLIAISHEIKKSYINLGIDENRIWLITNPVDTTSFYLPSTEERQRARYKIGIKNGSFVHLLIGGYSPRKNQKFAINYIKILPENHILILAGPVYPDRIKYYKDLQETITNNCLSGRVRLIEGLQTDVTLLYHASDLFCLPSINEGMPNVVLEALCCGLPVLINENLGLQNVIKNNLNGWNLPLQEDIFKYKSLECEIKMNDNSVRNRISDEAIKVLSAEKFDMEFFNRLNLVLKR